MGEALDVRRRILRAFEAAELETDPEVRRACTTFVVIGGGPTGVELAGALAEIAGRTLARDFRRFDPRTTRVILVEAGGRILSTFPEELSAKAQRQLEALGIEVRTGTRVTDLGDGYVEIGDESIATHTVLWAAGVRASPLATHLGVALDRVGPRVGPGRPFGAWPPGGLRGGRPDRDDPGRPAAARGRAARAPERSPHCQDDPLRAGGQGPAAVPLRDKGSMATIGRDKAVAQIGRFRFSGFFAWWLWLVVHMRSLVDFRSRLGVLFEWAWAYFTWQRGSHVILEVPSEPPTARASDGRAGGARRQPDARGRAGGAGRASAGDAVTRLNRS